MFEWEETLVLVVFNGFFNSLSLSLSLSLMRVDFFYRMCVLSDVRVGGDFGFGSLQWVFQVGFLMRVDFFYCMCVLFDVGVGGDFGFGCLRWVFQAGFM
jgi:hypothetical protein